MKKKSTEKPVPEYEPLLTTNQACELLGISRSSIFRWREQGEVPYYRVGSDQIIRYKRSEIENYMRKRKIEARDRASSEDLLR